MPRDVEATPPAQAEQPLLSGGSLWSKLGHSLDNSAVLRAQLWILLAAVLSGLDRPLGRIMWHRAHSAPWSMLDALHHIIAAAALFAASAIIQAWQAYHTAQLESKSGYMAFDQPERQVSEVELTGNETADEAYSVYVERQAGWLQRCQGAFMHALTCPVSRITLVGLEQGVLSWAIEELWRIGFEHHLSPRRAMITSTFTIIAIPLLAKVAKQAVSSTLFLASLGVLAGSAMLHIDIVAEWTSSWGGNVFGFAWGDIFLAMSIAVTAWRAVRLATYAHRFPALDLAKWAMLPQAVLATAWLVHEPLDKLLDNWKGELWAGWSDPVCWALIIWFSLSSHAIRGFLINKGQAVLAAAQVNNVLTNDQVVRILVGHGFGHVSHMGWLGVGGVVVLVAATVGANIGGVSLA